MTRLLRTSERTLFKRCRFAWNIAYEMRLRPEREAEPLWFGSLVHAALAAWYKPGVKRGRKPWLTFEAEFKEAYEKAGSPEEDWDEARELGLDMLRHYVEHYGEDEDVEVLATEQPFQVEILHPARGHIFTYVGVVDGLWRSRSTGRLSIPDHKTARSISTGYLTVDDQAGAYWTFGTQWLVEQGLLAHPDELDGVVFNFLRKAKKDTRPQNEAGLYLNKPTKKCPEGEVSKSQPPPYFHRELTLRQESEREAVRKRVLAEYLEMGRVRRGTLSVLKSPSPMNCAICSVKDVCELHEIGADWGLLLSATSEPWDPYAEHEIYVAETK